MLNLQELLAGPACCLLIAVKPAETAGIASPCEEERAAAGPAQSLTQLYNGKTTAPHSTILQPDTPLPRSAGGESA